MFKVGLERFKNLMIETMVYQDDGKVVGNVVGGSQVSCSKVAGDGKVIGNMVGGPTLSHGKVVGNVVGRPILSRGKVVGNIVGGPILSQYTRSSVEGCRS